MSFGASFRREIAFLRDNPWDLAMLMAAAGIFAYCWQYIGVVITLYGGGRSMPERRPRQVIVASHRGYRSGC